MKTIQMTYCKRFDNSCYHHQCIANFCTHSWKLVWKKSIVSLLLKFCPVYYLFNFCPAQEAQSYPNEEFDKLQKLYYLRKGD